jgi:hypothetical protein
MAPTDAMATPRVPPSGGGSESRAPAFHSAGEETFLAVLEVVRCKTL